MKEFLNILLLGRGGREGALAEKILKSPRTRKLYTMPGEFPGCHHLPGSSLDFDRVAEIVGDYEIDLVVAGPEASIVAGIYDALSGLDVKVIAPDSDAARLEGSKEFAKEFMISHAIPSPRFMSVTSDTLDEGLSFLESQTPPYVIKADGLAGGRGVLIVSDLDQAKATLTSMIDGLFGESSQTVIVEEFVPGPECSLFYAIDGEDYIYLGSALDYKRFEDGDQGPNTAGLGAVSPALCIDKNPELIEKVEKRILLPTIRGLKEEGIDYRGFLYLGLKEVDGEPVMLEYNVRLGDPESQVLIPRMKSDIIDIFEGIADRTLALKQMELSPIHAVGVVLTAEGYPDNPRKGDTITGIQQARNLGCSVYTGAVSTNPEDGAILTDGGRIATVVGLSDNPSDARNLAYKGVNLIDFYGKYNRSDIGL
ncbi:MAG: phosphoribosylamine--glycine ligase [Muribaculaceae bacterium]|nr:phosphoribosylamine--glycine ligase [Muribaculaceae bacterium]